MEIMGKDDPMKARKELQQALLDSLVQMGLIEFTKSIDTYNKNKKIIGIRTHFNKMRDPEWREAHTVTD